MEKGEGGGNGVFGGTETCHQRYGVKQEGGNGNFKHGQDFSVS